MFVMVINMKKLMLALVLTGVASVAGAASVTFEGLASGQVLTSLDGLSWSGFSALNTSSLPTSGLKLAATSGSFVAFNKGAGVGTISSATPFSLVGADLTAGWRDGLSVTVVGKLGGSTVSSTTYTLSATSPTHIAFGLGNVDSVSFTSFGGTPHQGYNGAQATFALDTLTIAAAVPEPETYAMLLAGLGLMGAVARRRNKRA